MEYEFQHWHIKQLQTHLRTSNFYNLLADFNHLLYAFNATYLLDHRILILNIVNYFAKPSHKPQDMM